MVEQRAPASVVETPASDVLPGLRGCRDGPGGPPQPPGVPVVEVRTPPGLSLETTPHPTSRAGCRGFETGLAALLNQRRSRWSSSERQRASSRPPHPTSHVGCGGFETGLAALLNHRWPPVVEQRAPASVVETPASRRRASACGGFETGLAALLNHRRAATSSTTGGPRSSQPPERPATPSAPQERRFASVRPMGRGDARGARRRGTARKGERQWTGADARSSCAPCG